MLLRLRGGLLNLRGGPLFLSSAIFPSGRAAMSSQPASWDASRDALPGGGSVVSTSFLAAQLGRVTLLDASWFLPAAKRDGKLEHALRRIPTARHFDINAPGLCDAASPLPHMLPRARELGAALAALGVRHSRAVVVYDSQGLFSAARAWYQLRAFGHPRVAVLEGGLPRWLAEGRPVATEAEDAAEEAALAGIEAAELGAPAPEVEEWVLDEARVRGLAQVREAAAQRARLAGAADAADALRGAELLLDARPAARFAGAEPEPRAGLRSGHVPGARSVPHSSVLDSANHNALLPRERLVEVFRSAGVDVARPGALVASCGSGVTGCVLALALVQAGRPLERTALYDGSWAEYGAAAAAEAPLAVGAPEGDAETEALKK